MGSSVVSDVVTASDAGIEPESGSTEATPEPRWGMADVVAAFVIAQFASLVGFSLFAMAKGVPATELSTESLTIAETALLQIPLWAGLLGVPLLSARFRGNGPRRDFGLWSTFSDVPVGLAIGVASQLVLVPIVMLPVLLLTDTDEEAIEAPARELTERATDADAGGFGILLLVLVVVVAAPLAEEVFFRGMLQRTLARSMSIWPAMIVTSLVFGISHFQPLQFPALAAFGLVLSVLAHRTGRLGRSIWAHVGFNATTIVALLALG